MIVNQLFKNIVMGYKRNFFIHSSPLIVCKSVIFLMARVPMALTEGSLKIIGKSIMFMKQTWLKFMLLKEECPTLGSRVGEVKVLPGLKEFRVHQGRHTNVNNKSVG